MFSARKRSTVELTQLIQTLSGEYGWTNLSLQAADRGFYGETWVAEADQGRFFVKLIAYRRHMAGFLQSLPVVCRMNDMGLDFISRPLATSSGDWFVPVLDGVLAAFRFEEGLHTEEYPLEKLFVRMADVYRLPTQDLELPWEQFGMNEYLGYREALAIARASDAPAVKRALAVIDAHQSRLTACEAVLRQMIPVCRDLPVHRVVTSGDVGGNVLLRDGEMIVVDWDQLMIAPAERDLWFYMQDMRQIDLIDEVLEQEHMPFRMHPPILAYYACSRTFFYLREYLFASMAEDGERTEAQLQEFFDTHVRKCVGQAERIAAQIRGEKR